METRAACLSTSSLVPPLPQPAETPAETFSDVQPPIYVVWRKGRPVGAGAAWGSVGWGRASGHPRPAHIHREGTQEPWRSVAPEWSSGSHSESPSRGEDLTPVSQTKTHLEVILNFSFI